MFKFLKKKLKGWFKSSKEKAEKIAEAPAEEKKEKPKVEKEPATKPEKEKKVEAKAEETPTPQPPEKKGFFAKLKEKFKFKITEQYFEEIFSDLELVLLENNVALGAAEKIKEKLKQELVGKEVKKQDVEKEIKQALKDSIENLLIKPFDFISRIKEKKEPFVIVFFGINGSGKTTTIAKICDLLQKNKISCVLAAGDTFRAASIEQLQKHADKLQVKLIKSQYGADPASVAFDAVKHASSHKIKAVLIDTAGRMHTKQDLMREMEKISRVSNPDLKIFVAESITGNDVIEQAKAFNEAVGIDAIILTKADIDEKAGTVISVSHVTNKPILFLGTGQNYEDLEKFDKEKIIEGLEL